MLLIAVVSEMVALLLLNFQTLPEVKFCGLVILKVPVICIIDVLVDDYQVKLAGIVVEYRGVDGAVNLVGHRCVNIQYRRMWNCAPS